MTAAVAIVLSFVESQIPTFIALPGVKLGLANIAIMFTLYKLGVSEAFIVSIIRALTVFLIFGGIVALIYTLCGAIFSLVIMCLLRKLSPFSEVGVSVAGGVSHNIAQVAVAFFMLDASAILLYLPVLLFSGTVAGVVIGIVSGILIRRINLDKIF